MPVSDSLNIAIHQSEQSANNRVAILDCGAQYTKVIDRRVRGANIASDIFPLNTPASSLDAYAAIIISGGPNSVHSHSALEYDPAIFELNKPMLGICYGMQLISQHFGGVVQAASHQEYGETVITISNPALLFEGLAPEQSVLMSHGDHVTVLPSGFESLAVSSNGIQAAIHHTEKPIYGLQFHPEVDLSQNGVAMLQNFLYRVASLNADFTLDNRLETSLAEIQSRVGNKTVLTLVSGGVDSAVTTALLLKALPAKQVMALHIDTGMMRLDESDAVCEALKNIGLENLQHLKAESDFLNATSELEDGTTIGPLCQTENPEHKRRIIGDTFLKLTQQAIQAANLNLDETIIAQGTLRPDLIESGNSDVSETAHTIKTHHNDVPLIQEQRKKGLIIETNRDWHKDEVREIGRKLGLSDDIISRQPFPGPGLGIRILCSSKSFWPRGLSDFKSQLEKLTSNTSLTPCILPIQSVGVQGDARSYKAPVALFPTAKYPSASELHELAKQIPNACHAINRVLISLLPTPEVLAQPDITETHLTHDVLTLLRQIDALVLNALATLPAFNNIAQAFAVLLPVHFSQAGNRSIVIRAVVTNDFMTARPALLESELPISFLNNLAREITQKYPEIDAVFYDLTPKPPGTVEWE